MSYYDPWAHGFWIIFNRVVLFFFASMGLSLMLWSMLLQHFFSCDVWFSLRSAWSAVQGEVPTYWRLLFWSTVGNSVLFTAMAFIPLLRFGQLVRGDRHRRGARVLGNDDRDA
jgi:hypothetical protein